MNYLFNFWSSSVVAVTSCCDSPRSKTVWGTDRPILRFIYIDMSISKTYVIFLYFKFVTDHSMPHVNGECKIWSCLPWFSYGVAVFAEENKWMHNANISDTSPAWEVLLCQFPAWRLEDPIFSTIWDAVKGANFWTWW